MRKVRTINVDNFRDFFNSTQEWMESENFFKVSKNNFQMPLVNYQEYYVDGNLYRYVDNELWKFSGKLEGLDLFMFELDDDDYESIYYNVQDFDVEDIGDLLD